MNSINIDKGITGIAIFLDIIITSIVSIMISMIVFDSLQQGKLVDTTEYDIIAIFILIPILILDIIISYFLKDKIVELDKRLVLIGGFFLFSLFTTMIFYMTSEYIIP